MELRRSYLGIFVESRLLGLVGDVETPQSCPGLEVRLSIVVLTGHS